MEADLAPLDWYKFLSKNIYQSLRMIEFAAQCQVLLILLSFFNLLKPTDRMMHQQFNIQQFYVLPTLYLCVLYLSENKQRLVPLTA